MKRLTVDLSDKLHSEFKAVAAKQGASISAVVRGLILHWLQEQEKTPGAGPVFIGKQHLFPHQGREEENRNG